MVRNALFFISTLFYRIWFAGLDLYQYYIQIVPTKIRTVFGESVETCQYSLTQRNRAIDHSQGSHGTPGIFLKYDLSAIMVAVQESHRSYVELFVRLCAIVGGVFATFGKKKFRPFRIILGQKM